jgi:hypothetical protein
MVKHIVIWKLIDEAEGNSKSVNRQKVTDKLHVLVDKISVITSLETGDNFNPSEAAYDLVLITTHTSRGALARYIEHPAHKEAASFIGKVVADRRVVDFEY